MAARRSNFQNNGSEERGITRRSFLLGGGAGLAAFMLPLLGDAGGVLTYSLIPSRAYADEGQESNPTADVIVLSRKEIGIQVYDVTDDYDQVPVRDASVVLTSFMEGAKPLEAVTDQNGAVVFDISAVSPVVDTGTAGVCYRFEGSASISNGDGYRICTLEKIRVDGGTAMALPCCKITDPTLPYFEYLSFNKWDMQYFDCTVLRCREATDKIPISGKLHIKGSRTVKISFWDCEIQSGKPAEKSLFEMDVDTSSGVGEFERKDLFLRSEPSTDALLPIDRLFEVHVEANGVCYVFPVQLHVCKSPFQYQHGTATVVPGVSYGPTGMEHEAFQLPSSFPKVLSGSQFTAILPMFPFDAWISPLGFAFFGMGLCGSKDASSTNGFRSDGFHNDTVFSLRQSFNEMMDRWERKFNQYNEMVRGTDPGSTKKFAHSFSATIGFSIAVQASLFANFNILADPETEKWLGQAAFIVDLYAFATLVEQLSIGPVPCFISLSFTADARMAAFAATESPAFNVAAACFSADNSGVAVVITLGIALTIGLGISGVISAGVRGSGSISMYLGIIEPKVPDNHRHLVVSAALSADVVLQALMFSWSGKIWGENWPCVYDSWSSKEGGNVVEGTSQSLAPTGFALGTSGDGTGVYHNETPVASTFAGAEGDSMDLGEFGRIARIVTSEQLLQTAELRAVATNAVASDSLPGDPEEIGEGTGVFSIPWSVVDEAALGAESMGGEDGFIYEGIGEDPNGYCAAADGPLTVAASGGLASQTEVKIVSQAFSNPREKVVVYQGTTIMFRIATVQFDENGQSVGRSRLVAQIFNSDTMRWGRPQVLDIPTGLSDIERKDMLDCDFDVCVQSDSSVASQIYEGIYIGMLSTRRQNGDGTSFYQSALDTVVTVAVFNHNLRRMASAMWHDDPGSKTSDPSAITCPRITTLQRHGKPFYVVMSYLRHTARNSEDLFTANSNATCCIAVPFGSSILHTSSIEVDGSTNGIAIADAGSIMEVDPDQQDLDDTRVLFSLFLQSSEGTDIYTVSMRLNAQAPSEGDAAESEPENAAAEPETAQSDPAAANADAESTEMGVESADGETSDVSSATDNASSQEDSASGSDDGEKTSTVAAATASAGAVVAEGVPAASGDEPKTNVQVDPAAAGDATVAPTKEGEPAASTFSGPNGIEGVAINFETYHNLSGPVTGFNDMRPWPGHSSFLSLEDGRLKEFSYEPLVENQQLSASRMVGPSNISFSSYKISDNGNVLFYAENVEGDESLPFDEDGNPAEPQPVKRYRVFASIYVDGLFSEPFPLVETKNPLDSIQIVAGGASYAFVFTSFTNVANSMADLYYLDAPIAAAATVLGVAAESIFALQGEDASFILSLRNDGNVMLTGCTATLHDAETGAEVDSAQLAFSSETICSSVWSSDFEEVSGQEGVNELPEPKYSEQDVEQARAAVGFEGPHVLADSDVRGVLIPGRSAQYRVTFTIPNEWHGTKRVFVSLSNLAYETIVSAVPDGQDGLVDPVNYAASHDILPRASVDIHFADDVFNPGMSAPPVGVVSEDGRVVHPAGGNDGANGQGAHPDGGDDAADGKGKVVGLSDTGDPLGWGAVGLAAGAAVAAFAAYSARRTALEREGSAAGEGTEPSPGETLDDSDSGFGEQGSICMRR